MSAVIIFTQRYLQGFKSDAGAEYGGEAQQWQSGVLS